MSILSWLIFLPLQLCWIPISILGGVLVGYRQLVISRRVGVSQTAIEILNGRWTMSYFGMRADPGADALIAVLPNTSKLGLQLALSWAKLALSWPQDPSICRFFLSFLHRVFAQRV